MTKQDAGLEASQSSSLSSLGGRLGDDSPTAAPPVAASPSSPTHKPLRVLSLGGGTQSCALALMSAAGELPKLDRVVFADTHGELPETYAYLDYLRSVLDAVGIPLDVVSAGSLEAALLAPTPTSANPTPPAYVRNPDGTRGRINRYRCSYDFKRRLIDRRVRQLCGGKGAWKTAAVEQWIGFSLEEVGRMRQQTQCRCGDDAKHHGAARACTACDSCGRFDPWQVNRWPLIELGMRRADTIAWFRLHGHPVPPRSACWFCPNGTNARWQQLRADHPDLFQRACVIDETIRVGSGFNDRGSQAFVGELFLHRSMVPLREADLRTAAQVIADAGQGQLFDYDALGLDCAAGVCFT